MMRQDHRYQKTLKRSVMLDGKGVHTGQPCTLHIHPAPAHHGVVFYRDGQRLPAHWSFVCDTRNATTLGHLGGASMSMVEHILAACYGMGISNLSIECIGSEVPISDGSASVFVDLFISAGIQIHSLETSWIVIKETITLQDGIRMIQFSPGWPQLTTSLLVGKTVHQHSFYPLIDPFEKDIAPARTFAQLHDVEDLRAQGLIKGGSLSSALVLKGSNPINSGGFRFPNECARHKLLDLMGDLATLGHFFYGQINTVHTGHSLNHRMIAHLMQQPHLFDIVSFKDLPKQKQTAFSKAPVHRSRISF